jgi:hypothetical protein
MNNHNIPNNYTVPEVKIIFICTERLFAASETPSATRENYEVYNIFDD